jgi:hypothetical protein
VTARVAAAAPVVAQVLLAVLVGVSGVAGYIYYYNKKREQYLKVRPEGRALPTTHRPPHRPRSWPVRDAAHA